MEENLEKAIIQNNIEMLTGEKFFKNLYRESIGGNAGKMHAGVNSYINHEGRIMEFSNYPTEKPYETVTFRVEMSYLSPQTRKEHNGPFIDGIYFEGYPEIPERNIDGIEIKGTKFSFPVQKKKFEVSNEMAEYMLKAVKKANKLNRVIEINDWRI